MHLEPPVRRSSPVIVVLGWWDTSRRVDVVVVIVVVVVVFRAVGHLEARVASMWLWLSFWGCGTRWDAC